MVMEIELPQLLEMPEKCLKLLTEFNSATYFLLYGGRGSGKTQSIARLLLYLGSIKSLRVFCGRETQASIEDSVHAVLADLIDEYDLDYKVTDKYIEHNATGTRFRFKGFYEHGRSRAKGIEGVDILWIDEAQDITRGTLQVVMPTIRKRKSKVIFSMNRFLNDDAVWEFCQGMPNCCSIEVNYCDNPFLSRELAIQAQEMRGRNPREYEHVWLGKPLPASSDILMSWEHIKAAQEAPLVGYETQLRRVMGIDFAAQGDDMCVATCLDKVTSQRVVTSSVDAWSSPVAMEGVGRIVDLIGRYRPDVVVIDADGMGTVVYSRLKELGIANLYPFFGGGVETLTRKDVYVNQRAESYFNVKEMVEDGILSLRGDAVKQACLELGKMKFKYRSSGKKLMYSKAELKSAKEIGHSPDYADSLMMAVYGLRFLSSVDSAGVGVFNRGDRRITRVVGNRYNMGYKKS